MTAAELIEKLKLLPPDTLVLVTDSSCCGCGCGPAGEMEPKDNGKSIFIDGDRFAGK